MGYSLKDMFIKKAINVHGERYDYSLVEYKNNKTKVIIICPEHGVFEQKPDKHTNNKNGCPKCSNTKKLNSNEFIENVLKVHGDKYDYSLVDYKNSIIKVKIICKKHGIFEQSPKSHLSGSGCPMCFGRDKKINEIIDLFNEKHNFKYDYSLLEYKNNNDKLKITCPTHGIFEQSFTTHIKGHGCPSCTNNKKLNTVEFIEKAINVHGNKYDYSLVDYKNRNSKVKIICKEHGIFEQSPGSHIIGSGCPKCKILNFIIKKTKTREKFISEATLVHGSIYNYSDVNYVGCKEYVNIICDKHGEYKQTPDSHLQGVGCPKCSLKYDKGENNIRDFLKEINIEFIANNKTIIKPFELDIFIPSHNIAIEYNGLYWHSDKFSDKNYHLNKTVLCEKQGIQLIHIFEDEWIHKKDIVKSRLKNIFGLTENRIFGRKCEIREVNSIDSKIFLNDNHIQGNVNSSIKIGLFYNNELVSLMTFGKGRIALGGKSNQYELLRFCNKLNTNVIGGADKLLKHFIKIYQPVEIISYADRRWSIGKLYDKLGFIRSHETDPNYWYVIKDKRKHRFGFRKSILVKEGFDNNKSEKEIMEERGIRRIYDCGVITYKKTLT